MKIVRIAVNGRPVRANWFVTPSPQSSTYAAALLTITCEVMCRVRPGTVGPGPPPVPSMTSFVSLAFFRAVWTSLTVVPPATVWAARELAPTNIVDIVAKSTSRLRRDTREFSGASIKVLILCKAHRRLTSCAFGDDQRDVVGLFMRAES